MSSRSMLIVIIAAIGLFIISQSLFTVNEAQKAIKFRFGEIVETEYTPGLQLQMPFINNRRTFDARLQTLDARPQQYLTFEKKNVLVDFFVMWRIADVSTFYITMSGGNYDVANQRLLQIVDKQLRDEFGKRTIQEVVSGERSEIMRRMLNEDSAAAGKQDSQEAVKMSVRQQALQFGIEIVDVRIKRVDLPRDVSESVFQRMRAERDRVAKELRARGRAEAERIRAEADRGYTLDLAEAYRQSEQIRGEGDAQATDIYASAFNKDREFYSLTRSLTAYKQSFSGRDDVIVLEPDSEFFKYFKNPKK